MSSVPNTRLSVLEVLSVLWSRISLKLLKQRNETFFIVEGLRTEFSQSSYSASSYKVVVLLLFNILYIKTRLLGQEVLATETCGIYW